MREYSLIQTVIANLPYMVMLLIGSIVVACSYSFSTLSLIGAASYIVYGIGGAVWIMIFICRYCGFYTTRGCPCGYGMVAARLVGKGKQECFAAKFKRHIPVIIPLGSSL